MSSITGVMAIVLVALLSSGSVTRASTKIIWHTMPTPVPDAVYIQAIATVQENNKRSVDAVIETRHGPIRVAPHRHAIQIIV